MAPYVGFANFIWACSEWGHQLQRGELEQLVLPAVESICADWPEPDRGGALRLGDGLARQVSSMCKTAFVSFSSGSNRLPCSCSWRAVATESAVPG